MEETQASAAPAAARQPKHGLGNMSPEENTFILALKICSKFPWTKIIACHLQEFPSDEERNPQTNDYRTRYSRQLRSHPVRLALEGQCALAASDHSLVIDYLRRYVPGGSLSQRGRTIMEGLPVVANAAPSGASLSHGSAPQAVAPPPAPAPSAPPVQQVPQDLGPTQVPETPEPFGWVFPALDQGPVVQEEQGQDDMEMESSAAEEQPEPVESIYPDPTLHELAPTGPPISPRPRPYGMIFGRMFYHK